MTKRTLISFIALFIISISCVIRVSAEDCLNWQKVREDQTTGTLNSVIYADNKFVAAGNEVAISEDGIKWITVKAMKYSPLNQLTYANGRFVAVGINGTILTSEDGVQWITVKKITGQELKTVTYANNQFIAVGKNIILTSEDALNWVVSYENNAIILNQITYGITYGSGKYIAVGNYMNGYAVSDKCYIAVSKDCKKWDVINQDIKGYLKTITFAKEQFLITGFGKAYISKDGQQWNCFNMNSMPDINKVIYKNDMYTAVAGTGTILTSADGTEWESRTKAMDGDSINDITYSDGRYIAVSSGGDSYGSAILEYYDRIYNLIESNDGINWTKAKRLTLNKLNAVASNGDTFVAVGKNCTILCSMPKPYKPKGYTELTLKVNNPKMTVDSIEKEIDPANRSFPLIVDNHTLVPIRAIIDSLGGIVLWEPQDSRITIQLGSRNIILRLDNNTAVVNGVKKVMDIAPMEINNRTMLPLRFVAEELGCKVDWKDSDQSISIIYNDALDSSDPPSQPSTTINSEVVIDENNVIATLGAGYDIIGVKVIFSEGISKVTCTGIDGKTFSIPVEMESNEYIYLNRSGRFNGQSDHGRFYEGSECILSFIYTVNGVYKNTTVKTKINKSSYRG